MVFSKMFTKGMHLIEFENFNFFHLLKGEPLSEASERELSLRHPFFFNFQRYIKVLTKASKQEKLEDL